MELIDVIDTAVKVGLGALVSGLTTVVVTRLSHRADRNKELAKRKVDLLTTAVEKLEPYFSAWGRCDARIDGILRGGTPPGEFPDAKFVRYKELDSEFVKTREGRQIALSRLRLVGLTGAVDCLSAITKLEDRIREQIIFQKQLPNRDELEAYRSEYVELKKTLYANINAAVIAAYG